MSAADLISRTIIGDVVCAVDQARYAVTQSLISRLLTEAEARSIHELCDRIERCIVHHPRRAA